VAGWEKKLNDLRARMLGFMSDEERRRTTLLFEIYFNAYKLCGGEKIPQWLDKEDDLLQGFSPRKMLVSGELEKIRRVHEVLKTRLIMPSTD
jgi:hypothetical protein